MNKATAQKLGSRQKETMVGVLIRSKSAFEEFHERISYDTFVSSGDEHLAVIWQCTADFFKKWGTLPKRHELFADVEAVLENDPILSENLGLISDVLTEAFASESVSDDEVVRAVDKLKKFLAENVQSEIKQLVTNDFVVDLPEILQHKIDELASIEAITKTKVNEPFPEDWMVHAPFETTPTNVAIFDDYLDGGDAPGEVISFVGPYGSCKTTIAMMLAVEAAVQEQKRWLSRTDPNEKLKMVYMFSWEDDLTSLRHRAMAYAARVSLNSLRAHDCPASLSTAANLKPYERKMFNKNSDIAGEEIQGEIERMAKWTKVLNRNLRFIDFTGSDIDYRETSANMTSGVAAVIRQLQKQAGDPGVSKVVLDYAGAAAKRHCEYHGIDRQQNLRHLIGEFPMALKNKIATYFKCPVWIMHQVGTEAQGRSSGVAPKPTDMAEAKNFLENCNFGFGVSLPSRDMLCVLSCLKQRRAVRKPDRIVFIDGEFGSVVDTGGQYQVENGRIVSAADLQRVVTDKSLIDGDDHLFRGQSRRIGL